MKKILFTSLLVFLILPLTSITSEAAVTYKDVALNYRAYNEIIYLSEGGILKGDSGMYYPNRDVTRAEAVTMLGRAIGLNGTKRATQFPDVPVQSFASGYIQSAAEKKLLNFLIDEKFRPDQPIMRGEMALLINNAFGYEGHVDVEEAANQLKVRGIAQGITPTDFGNELKIKRADFAIFLARAINYKLRSSSSISFNGERYVTAKDFLNVRTGPSTNFQKVGELPPGALVETAYSVGNWIYVKAEQVEGLVHQDFLSDTFTDGQPVILAPLSQQLIMIDPGHGGKDPGAIGYGLNESQIVLDTALQLKAILEKSPIRFQLTRETDIFYSPGARVQMAKEAKVDAFVSIHANAFNGSANGTETYYYNFAAVNQNWENSSILATCIQTRMIELWNLVDRGVKHGNYQVLRENSMPAVLVELGFIDNRIDNEKLKSSEWRQKAAEAIYFGILDYYQLKGYDVANLYNYNHLDSMTHTE